MNIGLIGAIDRNNYGDILFPLIVESELKRRTNQKINFFYYGTVESDLSKYGAHKTRALKDIGNDNLDVGIIVGGEILSATWNRTYLHLQNNKINILFNRIFNKLIGLENAEKRSRKKLELENSMEYPWVLNKSKQNIKKIIYNTVSGTDFSLINKSPEKFQEELLQADFISVRDSLTKNNLKSIGISKVSSFPDSAFKMSDIFPIEILEEKISSKVTYPHFCFQVGKEFAIGNESIIVEQLSKILSLTDLSIELVSIGAAGLHEDAVPLHKIERKLKDKGFEKRIKYIEGTIFETMYSIATSNLFIGTSLHGNITALSYGKPSIAIDSRVKKLTEFLKEYSIDEQLYGIDYKDIYKSFDKVMSLELTQKLYDNSVQIKKEIDENFDMIMTAIIS